MLEAKRIADAEGAGPVEIVTALAEDVQKAKQCKSRSAHCSTYTFILA